MATYDKFLSFDKEKMTSQLISWADINSGTTNLAGLSQMRQVLKEAFLPLGCSVEEVELPPYACLNDEGVLVRQPLGKALYFSKRPEAARQIFLGGHMDTVYQADSPFQKVERRGDILQGPGVTDMKGGLLIMLKSLEALESSPFAENIGWHAVINPDEEIGSPGSERLLREVAGKCRLGLIFEPCMANGSFVNARKGSINLTVVSRGKSAHAGREFHLGQNAISALCHFILEADKLTGEGITINVGKIKGGGPLNIVPDLAVCGVNVRVEKPEDMGKVKRRLQEIIEKAGFSLSLHFNSERFPKPFDKKTGELFAAFDKCAKEFGVNLHFQSSGGVTDGNGLGIPAIDSLGPLGGGIHTFEEFVQLDCLVPKTQLASLFLMKLGSGEIWI